MYGEHGVFTNPDLASNGLATLRQALAEDGWVTTAIDRQELNIYAVETGYAYREVTVRMYMQERGRNIGAALQVWRGDGGDRFLEVVAIGIRSQMA